MIESIIQFLPYSEQRLFPSAYTPGLRMKTEWIEESIPRVLIEVIGIDILLDAPTLPWRVEYTGSTGYIDNIQVMDAPIMIGKDESGRAFISMRTGCDQDDKEHIVVLFQRYSDDKGTWTYGTRSHSTWMSGLMYFCQNHKISNKAFESAIREALTSMR